jgi:NAD(P)-dependent dehydrogenase (short-subunit alcohol dehydrogenase family)
VARLAGKSAVITGGASGIGRAAAERFRTEGAAVIVADLRPGERQEEFFPCDVAVAGDVARLAAHALERFGHVDILFANAGVAAHDASTTMAEAAWERVFAVDVKGLWLVGYPGLAAYGAAKAAAINLARTLAAEAGSHGVRVNALCPGPTLTPGLEDWFEQVGDDQVSDRLAAATLLGRLATAAEIASAALFLASDDSSYVTGAALVADGGYTAL